MEAVAALRDFGVTGLNAVLLAAIAYLARFILTRYDADINAKSALASALEKLTDAIRETRK